LATAGNIKDPFWKWLATVGGDRQEKLLSCPTGFPGEFSLMAEIVSTTVFHIAAIHRSYPDAPNESKGQLAVTVLRRKPCLISAKLAEISSAGSYARLFQSVQYH
jgi:hypothetical protein